MEYHQGVRTVVPLEEDAPPFVEQRWREDLVALGVSAESIAAIVEQLEDPNAFIGAVSVSRDDAPRPSWSTSTRAGGPSRRRTCSASRRWRTSRPAS
ncbi:hypothetical protein ACOACO_10545 [Nocardioides sp. CPCC 205120]|uniref:hypothetical protein n=1 Tax=Nocardioides sp. CPCC 205120 TaxID=3406462 RepID=UPI003B506A3F